MRPFRFKLYTILLEPVFKKNVNTLKVENKILPDFSIALDFLALGLFEGSFSTSS